MSDPSPYPSMPGEPIREPVVAGPPPSSVVNAVKLMLLRAGLSLLGLLVLILSRDALKQQIRKSDRSFSPSQIDSAVTTAITVGTVIGIIVLGLYVLLALQVRKGKSWARIVTMVLAALSVLSGLGSFAQPVAGLSRALGLVSLVIDIAILVLLAQGASARYFRRTS